MNHIIIHKRSRSKLLAPIPHPELCKISISVAGRGVGLSKNISYAAFHISRSAILEHTEWPLELV